MFADHGRVGVEIEQVPHAGEHARQLGQQRGRHVDAEQVAIGIGRGGDPAAAAADPHGTQVTAVFHALGVRGTAGRQEIDESRPRERRAIGEFQ